MYVPLDFFFLFLSRGDRKHLCCSYLCEWSYMEKWARSLSSSVWTSFGKFPSMSRKENQLVLLFPAENRKQSLISWLQTRIWDLCNFAWIEFMLCHCTTSHRNLRVAMKLTVTKGIEQTWFSSTCSIIVRRCCVSTPSMASIVNSQLVSSNWCLTFLSQPW